jgi:hypothetical protein
MNTYYMVVLYKKAGNIPDGFYEFEEGMIITDKEVAENTATYMNTTEFGKEYGYVVKEIKL